ncbi:MAG: trypsin-like peptidase domain-containing protein [bacterium]
MHNKKKIQIIVALIFVALMLGVSAARAGFFNNASYLIKGLLTKDINIGRELGISSGDKTISAPLYKPALDYEEAVVSAVEGASPSVVSIVITKDVPLLENCTYDPFADMPSDIRSMFGSGTQFSRPCESTTQKETKEIGGGSGFIVSTDGLILTNKHVVSDTKADYTVFTSNGKKYSAKVLARDTTNDIALIKIEATGLKAATLGNSDSIKLGQTAIVIGNALGEFRNTVSTGVISGLSRNVTAGGASFGSETISGVIQTDAAINPGNSGGPLLNLRGEVIGMNTAMADGAQNIGFAIPINQAKRAIESVKKTGSIKNPYIGVRYMLLNEETAKKQKLSLNEGALVRGTSDGPAIVKGSPADKAGIQAEDIIMAVNDDAITAEKTVTQILQKYGVGDLITLKIKRGENIIYLSLKLEERPESL